MAELPAVVNHGANKATISSLISIVTPAVVWGLGKAFGLLHLEPGELLMLSGTATAGLNWLGVYYTDNRS